MRRRLTVVMIGMVVGALVVAGLVTLLLTVRSSRQDTRRGLVTQAQALASALARDAGTPRPNQRAGAQLKNLLGALRQPLRLQGEAVLAVGPEGRVFDVAAPLQPVGLP